MANKFIDFPQEIDQVLREIAIEQKMKFRKETHYDAIDRELQWAKENKFFRLNFDFSGDPSSITVHRFVTLVPGFFFPKILLLYEGNIPFFAFFTKKTWQRLSDFPLGFSKEEYRRMIEKIIQE